MIARMHILNETIELIYVRINWVTLECMQLLISMQEKLIQLRLIYEFDKLTRNSYLIRMVKKCYLFDKNGKKCYLWKSLQVLKWIKWFSTFINS